MGWGWSYIKGLAGKAEHLGGDIVHGAESAWNGTVDGFEKAGGWLENHLTAAVAPRPQGTNGHDVYLMFHGPEAKGTSSIDSCVTGWRQASSYHQQAGDALNSAMSKLGSAWQGQAAQSATASVTPLRDAADSASQQALKAGNVLEAQSSTWNDTAHKVINVPTDPPRMSIVQVDPFSPVVSHVEAQAYTTGQQGNQQAFSNYGTTTTDNTKNVPQFAPPTGPSGASQPSGMHPMSAGSVSGSQSGGVFSGSLSTVHSPSASGRIYAGAAPAATQSAWQVPESLRQPAAGQGQGQGQGQTGPGAGIAAGAAGVITGGGALLGTSALGGGSIGGRLAGGDSSLGSGGSSANGGSLSPGGQSGTDASEGEEQAAAVGGARGSSGIGSSSTSGSTGASGAGGKKKEDKEHQRPDYLLEANPHEVFGQDRRVAPPVFGAQPDPVETD